MGRGTGAKLAAAEQVAQALADRFPHRAAHLVLGGLLRLFGGDFPEFADEARLDNVLGAAGSENVQGEQQQKLDVIANNVLMGSPQEVERVRSFLGSQEE
jgi:fructose-1,6-bisphosphatase